MTERKTIYLDDALEAIRKLPNAGIHWFVSAEAVFDALLKLPSAQSEIIHCRDCVKCQYDTLFDQHWCNGIEVQEDFFCKYAERRTDG